MSTGASNDLQRATALAHDMVARFGMSDRIGAVSFDNGSEIFVGRDYERTKAYSEQTGAEIDDEIRHEISEAYSRCTDILKTNYDKLRQVAEFLLAHETMSRCQFEACMKGEPIPDEAEGFFEAVSPAAPVPPAAPQDAPSGSDRAPADSADIDSAALTDTP